MSAMMIWIDSQEAKLFTFEADGVRTQHLKPHGPHHHDQSLGRNHTKAEGDAQKFYHEVCQHLAAEKSVRWLIAGPGLAHTHLVHHLEKHHPALKAKVVGVQALEKMSDGQLIDKAKEFFSHQGVFGGPA